MIVCAGGGRPTRPPPARARRALGECRPRPRPPPRTRPRGNPRAGPRPMGPQRREGEDAAGRPTQHWALRPTGAAASQPACLPVAQLGRPTTVSHQRLRRRVIGAARDGCEPAADGGTQTTCRAIMLRPPPLLPMARGRKWRLLPAQSCEVNRSFIHDALFSALLSSPLLSPPPPPLCLSASRSRALLSASSGGA